MPSAVVVDDPAALLVAVENVLRLELVELGARLVIAKDGALAVGQRAQASVEMCSRIGKWREEQCRGEGGGRQVHGGGGPWRYGG